MVEHRRLADYEMGEYSEATTPEHFKAFAEPTRQRIVNLLYERAATTKQLAGALGQLPGSISHHLKVLEKAGLVRVVRTRQVRAITEKYYGNTYRRVVFSDRDFSWREDLPEVEPTFMVRQALEELDFETKNEDPRLNMSFYGHARIPASRAGDFAERVLELAKEFEFEYVPGEKVYAFLAAVFLTNQPELAEEREGSQGAAPVSRSDVTPE